jgi:hypothetical protein
MYTSYMPVTRHLRPPNVHVPSLLAHQTDLPGIIPDTVKLGYQDAPRRPREKVAMHGRVLARAPWSRTRQVLSDKAGDEHRAPSACEPHNVGGSAGERDALPGSGVHR